MFIKKSVYKELNKKHYDMETEILNLRKIVEAQKADLEKYKSGEHHCDEMCEGCQNLIKGSVLHSGGYSAYGVREVTIKRCALDRTCEDFKQKEEGKREDSN